MSESETPLLERLMKMIAATETLPERDSLKEVAETEMTLGTLPPPLQGLLTLVGEIADEHNELSTKMSEGDLGDLSLDDAQQHLDQLKDQYEQIKNFFWMLVKTHINPDENTAGSLVIRKGWVVAAAPREEVSEQPYGMPGGVRVVHIIGSPMGSGLFGQGPVSILDLLARRRDFRF